MAKSCFVVTDLFRPLRGRPLLGRVHRQVCQNSIESSIMCAANQLRNRTMPSASSGVAGDLNSRSSAGSVSGSSAGSVSGHPQVRNQASSGLLLGSIDKHAASGVPWRLQLKNKTFLIREKPKPSSGDCVNRLAQVPLSKSRTTER